MDEILLAILVGLLGLITGIFLGENNKAYTIANSCAYYGSYQTDTLHLTCTKEK